MSALSHLATHALLTGAGITALAAIVWTCWVDPPAGTLDLTPYALPDDSDLDRILAAPRMPPAPIIYGDVA